MAAAARPKRAAEEYARTHESASKKPRFDQRNPSTLAADAPEDDLILDADVIGKSGAQTKRNAVNIDGYESDSDNDNFNARAEQREREQGHRNGGAASGSKDEDEDDDDDMFADVEEAGQGTADSDEDEDLAREGKKRKKDVRFLDQDEIEGQELNSKSGGHISADLLMGQKGKKRSGSVSSSSSSGDDEERDMLPEDMEDELAQEVGAGGKKKHAPRLDAFNLRNEEEDGRFDESGNYVRKAADLNTANDRWLLGLTKKDMKRAKEAQEKRQEESRRKAIEVDAVLTSDLLSTLIQHLDTGETPIEAMQRLHKAQPKPKPKVPKWKKKHQSTMDVDESSNSDPAKVAAEAARKDAIEAIAGAADELYLRGQDDVYGREREIFMRQFKRETGDEWKPPAIENGASEAWEYRWIDARDNSEVHGPYDGPTMKAWNEAGYFNEGVEFKKLGESEWSRLLEVP